MYIHILIYCMYVCEYTYIYVLYMYPLDSSGIYGSRVFATHIRSSCDFASPFVGSELYELWWFWSVVDLSQP